MTAMRALCASAVEADALIGAARAALAAEADLLDRAERSALGERIAELERVRAGGDHRAIKAAIEALNRATEAFAAAPHGSRASRARWPGAASNEVAEMTGSPCCPTRRCAPKARRSRRRGRVDLQTLLEHHIDIEHACELSCACTTCHVIVREGYDSLDRPRPRRRTTCSTGRGASRSRRACRARRS